MMRPDVLLEGPLHLPGSTALRWRPPVRWTTRLWIRLDVAVHRGSPWVTAAGVIGILLLMTTVEMTLLLAGAGVRLLVSGLLLTGSILSLLILWATDPLVRRVNTRPARPDEIAALRLYARPATWSYVQDTAADWRRSCPQLPITMAMILRWQDEAGSKLRAALPPTIAEQAAVRAQARAFD